MADDPPPEWEYRVGKLELEAGDLLVVKVDEDIEPGTEKAEMLGRFIQGLSTALKNRVIVIDKMVDLSVLTKAEIEERAIG